MIFAKFLSNYKIKLPKKLKNFNQVNIYSYYKTCNYNKKLIYNIKNSCIIYLNNNVNINFIKYFNFLMTQINLALSNLISQ